VGVLIGEREGMGREYGTSLMRICRSVYYNMYIDVLFYKDCT
jgi:hypothetical protein